MTPDEMLKNRSAGSEASLSIRLSTGMDDQGSDEEIISDQSQEDAPELNPLNARTKSSLLVCSNDKEPLLPMIDPNVWRAG